MESPRFFFIDHMYSCFNLENIKGMLAPLFLEVENRRPSLFSFADVTVKIQVHKKQAQIKLQPAINRNLSLGIMVLTTSKS